MPRDSASVTKHLFVAGGVVFSLGKGLTAASIALLLRRRGYNVKIQKLDPCLNVVSGTMSPYQHGEVTGTDLNSTTITGRSLPSTARGSPVRLLTSCLSSWWRFRIIPGLSPASFILNSSPVP